MRMEKDLVSIVVPIYNVEDYLRECIDSILEQTYKNIEIILVNDGSQDNCGKICDEYGKRDRRIKVIHKKNGGLSDARNTGINEATGKYIAFVDSDDYVEKKYIELLYKAIKDNNTQISQCGIFRIDNEKKLLGEFKYNYNVVNNSRNMMIDVYNGKWENIVVWNKLYLKSLFDNIKFPKGKIHEDEFTTYKIYYSVDKVSIIKQSLYNYRKNENSITGNNYNIKRLDVLEALNERKNFFYSIGDKQLYNMTLELYLCKLRESYAFIKKYISNKEVLNKILKEYRKIYIKVVKENGISIKHRIKGIFFYIMPNIWFEIKKGKM